ncbi:hypothetical protein [Sutcliffiella sp. FSL R7-0096]|uniref:hypothetical protein n=1 Tax=Sutcliffiella sp. FSL R7-0096 TaxID=2921670 RepID=UPI00315AA78E
MSKIKTQKLLPEKVQKIFIQLDAQNRCYEGAVMINELQMRDGIISVELILKANQRPEVTIEYNQQFISNETAEVLGLSKKEMASSRTAIQEEV